VSLFSAAALIPVTGLAHSAGRVFRRDVEKEADVWLEKRSFAEYVRNKLDAYVIYLALIDQRG
jgi:hypothetical protein